MSLLFVWCGKVQSLWKVPLRSMSWGEPSVTFTTFIKKKKKNHVHHFDHNYNPTERISSLKGTVGPLSRKQFLWNHLQRIKKKSRYNRKYRCYTESWEQNVSFTNLSFHQHFTDKLQLNKWNVIKQTFYWNCTFKFLEFLLQHIHNND